MRIHRRQCLFRGHTRSFGDVCSMSALHPAAAAVTIQMLFVIPVTIKRGWFEANELAVLWLSVAIFFLIRGGGAVQSTGPSGGSFNGALEI
jgi:hypothetical protein